MGVPAAGPSRERQSGQTTATDSVSVGIPQVEANRFRAAWPSGSRVPTGGWPPLDLLLDGKPNEDGGIEGDAGDGSGILRGGSGAPGICREVPPQIPSPHRPEGFAMRLRLAAVAALVLGFAQVSAADPAVEDRAESLAKMAQRVDVQAAYSNVAEWNGVLRYALASRNQDLAKKAREGVKVAKRDLARAKDRSPKEYMDRARRVAEAEGLDRPDQDPTNRTASEQLSAGELYLERIRHAGPLVICGAMIEDNVIGIPEVSIAVANRTDQTIQGYEVEIECWNAFDEPVGFGGDNVFGGISQKRIMGSSIETGTGQLHSHQNAVRVSVRITRVKPTQGQVWEQTREEAERSPGAMVTAKMRR